jgi:LysR family carnitine catabolism transcriptional activator
MNFNLRQLAAFTAVARAASFTRAALELHVSQPALTVQIRNLESALGLRLLDRNTRRVQLTAVGRELLPVFERVLNDIAAVAGGARELAAGDRGVVHVAALPSVCSRLLPLALAELAVSHPNITVKLRDVVSQRVVALLKSEEADLGIAPFSAADRGLELRPLLRDEMVALLPATHRLAARRSVRLAELARERLVFMDAQTSVRAVVERALGAAGVPATPDFEVTYMSTAAGLVRAGLGVALLPSTAFELGALDGMAAVRVADSGLTRDIGIATKAGRSVSPAARMLVEALERAARGFSRNARPRSRRGAPSPAR